MFNAYSEPTGRTGHHFDKVIWQLATFHLRHYVLYVSEAVRGGKSQWCEARHLYHYLLQVLIPETQ